jgi:hypothetical protein
MRPNILTGQVYATNGKSVKDAEVYILAEWIVGRKPWTVGGSGHDTDIHMQVTTDKHGKFETVLDKPIGIRDIAIKELHVNVTTWSPDRKMCSFLTVKTETEPIIFAPLSMILSKPGSAKIYIVYNDGRGIANAKLVPERAENWINSATATGTLAAGAPRTLVMVPTRLDNSSLEWLVNWMFTCQVFQQVS